MKLSAFFILILWFSDSIAQEFYYKTLSTEDGLPSNQIHCVYSDSRGYIWFGTPNGAVRWDSKSFKTYTIEDGLPNNEVLGFSEDSRKRLWITSFSENLCYLKDNLIYNNKNDVRLKKMPTIVGAPITEFNNRLYYNSNLSIRTSFHIDSFKLTSDSNEIAFHDYYIYRNKLFGFNQNIEDSIKLNKKLVEAVFKATKYIAGNNSKFNRFVIDSLFNPSYRIQSELKNKINYRLYEFNNILFLVNEDCKIYSKNNVLVRFNSQNISNLFEFNNSIYYLSNKNIFSLKNKKLNTLGNLYGKIYNIDKKNSSNYIITSTTVIYELSNNLKIKKSINTSLSKSYNFKHTRYHPTSNQYFIGTGISFFQYKNSKFKKLKDFKTYCSFLDSRNRLWYSGLDKIFYQDNFEDNLSNEKSFVLNSKNKVFVKDITEDKYGNIIFTTNDGVYVYNSSTKIKYRLHNSNFLSSNECNKVVVDSSDNSIWVTTPFGLNHIQYIDSKGKLNFKLINRFFKSDGLHSNEINDVLVAGDSIWVATSKGLSLVIDKNYHPDSIKIPIQINSITINDSLYLKDTLETLTYNQNNISIDYSAIYFSRRDRLAIYYRLIKNNDTITKELTDRLISLISLESGQYTLQIYAYDKDYPYIKSDYKTLKFVIKPPYYQTWWFYLLILCTILGISYLIFRNRIKRGREIHEYETKLSQLKLEALKAEMNPHFIFNCLNAIKDYIMKNDTEKSQYYLDKLSKLIRQALYNSKDDFVNLRNEIQFIDNYVELENMRFDHHFDYFKEIDIEKFGHIQIPTMILQPFFENAIRHGKLGQMERRGKLFFTIFEDQNKLIIKIMDNGIGIEEAEKIKAATQHEHRSMAISIIKDRIEVYNKSYLLNINYTLLSIDNEEYRTQVVLTINLNNL